MISRQLLGLVALTAVSVAFPARAQAPDLVLEGEVTDAGGDYEVLAFDLPAGVGELFISHDDMSDRNILDWGLWGPDGFVGWGGGNTEPIVVGPDASSRSYLPSPLTAGVWEIVIGKAKLIDVPAPYRVELTFRDAATLEPDPDRAAFDDTVLDPDEGWYAGDFHVHSTDSGDAAASLDDIAALALERGLDFVVITDHNTESHFARLRAATERTGLLFLPGIELTTYQGHAGVYGASAYVDHRMGLAGRTMSEALADIRDQDALVAINHPLLDIGDACIGCAWLHDEREVDAVEVTTGAWSKTGFLFGENTLGFWDSLLDDGVHAAAIGGSDDHRAGEDLSGFQSPIGSPTTLVFARELSMVGVLDGVREGRTVVKLEGPDDPMLELNGKDAVREGDTLLALDEVTLVATVTGGEGTTLRFVEDGFPMDEQIYDVTTDPFEATVTVPVSDARYRAELWRGEVPAVITSNVWLAVADVPGDEVVCGCRAGAQSRPWSAAAIGLLLLALRRRRA